MTTSPHNPGCLSEFFRLFGLGTKSKAAPAASDLQEREQFPDAQKELEQFPFRLRDDFLSPAEASFFQVLQGMLQGRQLVFPKVSLSELFFVSHPEQNQAYFNKINRKVVDFVLCEPQTLRPSLAIELDDASHQRPDRMARDEFVNQVFAAAALPLVHIPARQAYQTQEIAQLLRSALASRPAPVAPAPASSPSEPPLCPKCGVSMTLRVAQRGANVGQKFFGCPNYPKCREVIPIA